MSRNLSPAYCVVQQSGSLGFQARMLFNDSNSEAARLFIKTNADTPWLNPGQIVIVADPASAQTAQMLSTLRQAKKKPILRSLA